MKNKINFITGETYTLSELFSGNRKIIIPDLQRDYCWGDEKHGEDKKELVSGYVNNLISQYISNKAISLSLGIIYGYEAPENHIQLCDGQQRITTLFLLLGMLNRKSERNEFRQCLISDYEYFEDDKEPYLQYSIRESSLYFIRDLVCNFFVVGDDRNDVISNSEEIKTSRWFFNEYNTDPSIKSMLKAVVIIENILKDKDAAWCIEFGNFITTRLSFLYYDMGTREQGEETFVVINTTGEPLSATQNLKPKVFVSPIDEDVRDTMPQQWEEIENWFWQRRKGNNDTSDAGFREFLRWVTLLNTTDVEKFKEILATGVFDFPVDKISFSTIYDLWQALVFLYENWEYKIKLNETFLSPKENTEYNKLKFINQIDCFILLPLIAYCNKWKVNDTSDRDLLRFYNFLINLKRIYNVQNNVNSLLYYVILIAVNCRDIIELLDNYESLEISKTIASEEELEKLRILRDNPTIRVKIEEAFWEAQDETIAECHFIWTGEIYPLVQWATDEQNVFSLSVFRKYLDTFDNLFICNRDSLDNVRRALLTRNLNGYPRIFYGNKNYSFCSRYDEWKILINDNIEQFKQFLIDLNDGKLLQNMIDEFPNENDYSEFVKRPYLLSYCNEKKIQYDDGEWLLIRNNTARKYISVTNMHLFNYLNNEIEKDGWKVWHWDGNRVVVENETLDIVIDIWNLKNKWTINLFKRHSEVKESLKEYRDDSWNFNGERYEKFIDFRKDNVMYTYPEVKKEVELVLSRII